MDSSDAFNVADMDNDGNMEVIMLCETATSSMRIREYETNATASNRFGTADLTTSGSWAANTSGVPLGTNVSVGDIDNDGDIEAVCPNFQGNNIYVVTLISGTYTATIAVSGSADPIATAIADIDSDGLKEIFYSFADAGNSSFREHIGGTNNFATTDFVNFITYISGMGTGNEATAIGILTLSNTGDNDNNFDVFIGRGNQISGNSNIDDDELFVLEATRHFGGGTGLIVNGATPTSVTAGSYDNVTISTGTATLSGGVTINGVLTLTSGILSIGSNTLTLAGTVSRTSGFLRGNYNNSNLVIQGSTAKTLFFDQTTDGTHLDPTTGTNAINNLTLSSNGNLVIGNKLNLFGTLTTATGTTLDMGDGIFVFRNTATTTARVGDLTAGTGTITGSPIAEIYIHEGRRAWRLLTNPTVGGTIANNWQNDFGYAGGYGTNIYGPSATNGLNSPATPNASMMKFNSNLNTTGGYDNVTNTGDNLDGTYFIYVRGDKTVAANPGGAANPFVQTTLASKGTIRTGTQTISLNFLANRYGAIANPYLSPVDLNLVTFNGIAASNAVYSWDPSLNTQGGWVTLNSTNSYASGNYTKDMQIGQAGLVLMDGSGTASVEFNENDKSSAKATAQTGVGNGLQDNLRTTLRIVNADGSKLLADEMFVAFKNGFNPNFDNKEDAIKMINSGENISSKRNNTLISVEARPYIQNADTIFMNFTNSRVANYEFTFNPSNFDATVTNAKLVDKFLNTETPISLSANTTVPFSITSTTGSNAADRFMIVFEGTGALPNKGFTVTGEKLGNNKVKINWEAQAETGVREYTLQRSVDGTNYTNINTQTAKNGNATQVYNYIDNEAKAGVNYYRVKTTQLNDIERYSQVITLNIKHSTSNIISVFPNPVKGNQIGLQLQEVDKGLYSVRILSMEGKEVYKQQLQVSGTSLNTTISPTSKLASGTYTLQVVGKNNSYTQKIVVE